MALPPSTNGVPHRCLGNCLDVSAILIPFPSLMALKTETGWFLTLLVSVKPIIPPFPVSHLYPIHAYCPFPLFLPNSWWQEDSKAPSWQWQIWQPSSSAICHYVWSSSCFLIRSVIIPSITLDSFNFFAAHFYLLSFSPLYSAVHGQMVVSWHFQMPVLWNYLFFYYHRQVVCNLQFGCIFCYYL